MPDAARLRVFPTFVLLRLSGSGRITMFVFPSEVEAEMKAGGLLHPGERKVPDAPAGPLAGMEEVEEPPG